jgi:hypothetical protein
MPTSEMPALPSPAALSAAARDGECAMSRLAAADQRATLAWMHGDGRTAPAALRAARFGFAMGLDDWADAAPMDAHLALARLAEHRATIEALTAPAREAA